LDCYTELCMNWTCCCVTDDGVFWRRVELSNVWPCCSRHRLIAASLQWLHSVRNVASDFTDRKSVVSSCTVRLSSAPSSIVCSEKCHFTLCWQWQCHITLCWHWGVSLQTLLTVTGSCSENRQHRLLLWRVWSFHGIPWWSQVFLSDVVDSTVQCELRLM